MNDVDCQRVGLERWFLGIMSQRVSQIAGQLDGVGIEVELGCFEATSRDDELCTRGKRSTLDNATAAKQR